MASSTRRRHCARLGYKLVQSMIIRKCHFDAKHICVQTHLFELKRNVSENWRRQNVRSILLLNYWKCSGPNVCARYIIRASELSIIMHRTIRPLIKYNERFFVLFSPCSAHTLGHNISIILNTRRMLCILATCTKNRTRSWQDCCRTHRASHMWLH